MDVEIHANPAGRITFELFQRDWTPGTEEDFHFLWTPQTEISHASRDVIQSRTLTNENSTRKKAPLGMSILLQDVGITNTGRGMLVVANAQLPEDSGFRSFYITRTEYYQPMECDIVVGKVIDGMNIVDQIGDECGEKGGKVKGKIANGSVKITDCGYFRDVRSS